MYRAFHGIAADVPSNTAIFKIHFMDINTILRSSGSSQPLQKKGKGRIRNIDGIWNLIIYQHWTEQGNKGSVLSVGPEGCRHEKILQICADCLSGFVNAFCCSIQIWGA